MGGGAMPMDLIPMIQFKPSTSAIPSSASTSTSLNFPVSVSETVASLGQSCTASSCYCQRGTCPRMLQCVTHGNDHDTRTNGVSPYKVVLGAVPSQVEVESAIASLQNCLGEVSSSGQLLLDCCGVRTLLSLGYGRVRDAFSLLQTDPSIKRLVISLASDKAVWDAVMSNEAVRKLQGSCYSDCRKESCEEESDIAACVLRWIMDITKAKIIELLDKFTLLMNEVFQPIEKEKPREETNHNLDDKVRSSLLLSIVILLIVVVARTHGA
ncbi:PREDICTED: uncharacterized protein LOC105131696 isoform X2 [Populus euphratica]|uniref:Uncharacterized protein LOC105131696 isoform X2 n=1 Tax=Populus euphratica TaxID=75702 RepID=A0AAJ6XW00_POPEU|nr:PREDICTED: uncharacterized protein LOC105131696 isoform X2 [Populus euphratica]